MNDPWDVKSVRVGHQYQSCMKINGVPLLPPLLSNQCRKEMQYYKLLAKEVEKRILVLKPYFESETDSNEDKTDAPELPEHENVDYAPFPEKPTTDNDFNVEENTHVPSEPKQYSPITDLYNSPITNETSLIIDLDIHPTDTKELFDTTTTLHHMIEQDELPERDCDSAQKPQKELNVTKEKEKEIITETECVDKRLRPHKSRIEEIDLDYNLPQDDYMHQNDGPSSFSSKSFTGSLHDLHSESTKEGPKLIRQSSYTVLHPSPLLLAHLEVQSLNTGIDVNCISMSESMSDLSLRTKKRRSWDLETAKVKWSNMALELKQASFPSKHGNNATRNGQKTQNSVGGTKSLNQERSKKVFTKSPKSDPIHKSSKNRSPIRRVPSDKTMVKETISPPSRSTIKNTPPKSASLKKDYQSPKESNDPATMVRELYEKLQKQQLMQMASLMEKQKREQQILQQVFEEQNTVLLKQLKTVCPKAPIEVKQAWGDLKDDKGRGPVSLSQLINTSTPTNSAPNSPVSKTLTDTNNYINKCDNMLKKSRHITNTIKKQQLKPRSMSQASRSKEPTMSPEGNRTRTHSPNARHTSRRLNYDTTPSSDYDSNVTITPRELLTDETNDTMADLNVTFPSDNSEEFRSQKMPERKRVASSSPVHSARVSGTNGHQPKQTTDMANRNLENSIQNSMDSSVRSVKHHRSATIQELVAATKIVACARGYLVRRLMRTERVQTTVQTIKDALLCALQLHQDREGIRGADVDLHRRLIQQITAACYSLHDTFIASSPAERCALIATDRGRKLALATRQSTPKSARRSDLMSQSYHGALPARSRPPSGLMTQSNYETFSGDKVQGRYMASPLRRPWR